MSTRRNVAGITVPSALMFWASKRSSSSASCPESGRQFPPIAANARELDQAAHDEEHVVATRALPIHDGPVWECADLCGGAVTGQRLRTDPLEQLKMLCEIVRPGIVLSFW
jgi:hypothetical protein